MTTFILKRVTFSDAMPGAASSLGGHSAQAVSDMAQQTMSPPKPSATPSKTQFQLGEEAGRAAGVNSAGVRTGIRNTWNRMGNWGKVGTVAGGTAALIGGGYLMGKGAGLWGNNNKKN